MGDGSLPAKSRRRRRDVETRQRVVFLRGRRVVALALKPGKRFRRHGPWRSHVGIREAHYELTEDAERARVLKLLAYKLVIALDYGDELNAARGDGCCERQRHV
jgi:hypothetical protein